MIGRPTTFYALDAALFSRQMTVEDNDGRS
jgi:hypothetical protein